jgi:hypothetical protein
MLPFLWATSSFKNIQVSTQMKPNLQKLTQSGHPGMHLASSHLLMEQHALKNVNNSLKTNIYSYLGTSGGQSSNLYLKVAYFFNTSVN